MCVYRCIYHTISRWALGSRFDFFTKEFSIDCASALSPQPLCTEKGPVVEAGVAVVLGRVSLSIL